MGLEMKIEVVKSIDAEQMDDVHRLIRQLSQGAILSSTEEFNEIIGSDKLTMICAIDGSRIVGMLSLVYFRIPTGLRARIEDVVVDESHRRRGIAKTMSELAIQKYRDSDARSLDLTSSPSRVAANELYLKLGFNKRETNVYRFSG